MRRLSSAFPVYPFLCFSVFLFLCCRPPTPSQLQRPVVHRHPSSLAAIYSRHLLPLSIRPPSRGYFRSISIRVLSFSSPQLSPAILRPVPNATQFRCHNSLLGTFSASSSCDPPESQHSRPSFASTEPHRLLYLAIRQDRRPSFTAACPLGALLQDHSALHSSDREGTIFVGLVPHR